MRTFNLSALLSLVLVSCGAPVPEQSEPGRQEPLPIIDVHLHASSLGEYESSLPVRVCANPTEFPPVFDPHESPRSQFLSCPEPLLSPMTDEELMTRTIEALQSHNIVAAVTSGPLESVRRWRQAAPERIIAGLSWTRPRETISLEDLRELVSSGELRVLGELSTQYRGFAPNDPGLEPFFGLAEELDVPVGIHMGLGGSIPGSTYTGDPEYRARLSNPLLLEEVLVRHPKLRLYVMHAGWPMLDEMIHLLFSHPQVYLDVAAINWLLPRKEFHGYLRRLVESGFGKRIMFGSDQMMWPDSIAAAIEGIESAEFLTAEQKRDIFYNNAVRFLKLEEPAESN
jgi:uncharacterized protein